MRAWASLPFLVRISKYIWATSVTRNSFSIITACEISSKVFNYSSHVRVCVWVCVCQLTFAKEAGAASEKDALILVKHLHGRLICKDQCKQPLNN